MRGVCSGSCRADRVRGELRDRLRLRLGQLAGIGFSSASVSERSTQSRQRDSDQRDPARLGSEPLDAAAARVVAVGRAGDGVSQLENKPVVEGITLAEQRVRVDLKEDGMVGVEQINERQIEEE